MSDTYVTLHGWVGSDVVLRKANGHSVVDLRVGSTARLKRGGDWVDGDTTWYTVTLWREHAENVLRSLKKGDPVIVHGRLRTEFFTRQSGEEGSKLVVDGALVGHDLRWGISMFARGPRQEPEDTDRTAAPGEGADRVDRAGPGAPDWGGVSAAPAASDEASDEASDDASDTDAA